RARAEEAVDDSAQIHLGVVLEAHDRAGFGERGVAALLGGLRDATGGEPGDPRGDAVAERARALIFDLAQAPLARDVTIRVPIDAAAELAEIGHRRGQITVGALELHQP